MLKVNFLRIDTGEGSGAKATAFGGMGLGLGRGLFTVAAST